MSFIHEKQLAHASAVEEVRRLTARVKQLEGVEAAKCVLQQELRIAQYKWARPAQLSRIMMRAVLLNGNCLQYASAGLKDDKEIVLRAVLVWRLEDVPPAKAPTVGRREHFRQQDCKSPAIRFCFGTFA